MTIEIVYVAIPYSCADGLENSDEIGPTKQLCNGWTDGPIYRRTERVVESRARG